MLIKTISTPESIVTHLLETIRSGKFPPGSFLPSERILQQELGVSRLALREALARLSALGIVQSRQGKGSYICESPNPGALQNTLLPLVTTADLKRYQDLFEARSTIEGKTTVLATRIATEAQIAQLTDILSYPENLLHDPQAFAQLDYSFHLKIAEIADNAYLSLMLQAFEPHIREFMIYSSRTFEDRVEAMQRHWPIVDAIKQRNEEKAAHLATTHMDACRTKLAEYLDQL